MSDAAHRVASVVLDQALDFPLDYEIPEQFLGTIQPGMRVKVPLRSTWRFGTIIATKSVSSYAQLVPIAERLGEEPLVSSDLFALAHWISQYYCCPLGKTLKSILPPSVRKGRKDQLQLFVKPLLSGPELIQLCQTLRKTSPVQAQVLDVLLQSPKGLLLSQLLERSQTSKSPVETLCKKQILSCQKMPTTRTSLSALDYFPTKPKVLNEEQQACLEAIQQDLSAGIFAPRLLFGVTGSGKTEVYLQAISHCLSLGKKVIFLVPEIALTTQTVERLCTRFQDRVALLHHRLSEGEKHDAWHQMRDGKISIVVGARSAIFSPVSPLGLIIVDEEQESSYKQSDEAPAYHGRDVAIMRAKLCNATLLLGSATPSMETYHNALSGKYALSHLSQRADRALLPTVQIVNMQHEYEKQKGFTLFSDTLLTSVRKRVELGEQCLLFLNRRGYHTAQICQSCSHIFQCPHCDIALTFHLGESILACHLCDYRLSPLPRECPSCKSESHLKFKGAGTELVERSLHAILPNVRTLRLDADTTRHKGSHELLFKQFRAGKADVLIGTQMIAKGLHFPAVTLVGILNADAHLQVPDFRASEQVFQLITQVSGRSGRASLAGEVIIQTHLPEHPVIRLAADQDFEGFYQQEEELRKLFAYPPFSYLVKILFSGPDKNLVLQTAQTTRELLMRQLPSSSELFPIIPCGYAKIKGNYRFQLLIKSQKRISPHLNQLKNQLPSHTKVRMTIDVDPLSTYS